MHASVAGITSQALPLKHIPDPTSSHYLLQYSSHYEHIVSGTRVTSFLVSLFHACPERLFFTQTLFL